MTSPCGGSSQRITAYLAELLQLSPAELRAVVVTLQGSPTSAAAAEDRYNVPADQDLVVFAIRGFHRFTDLPAENLSTLVRANIQPKELADIKMSNCTLQLENLTRSYKVFDNRDVQLGAIADEPEYFPQEAPLIVPAAHILKATFTLVDADLAGSVSTYGVKLTGVLIPKQK